jgi:hypothetical protein
MKKRLLNWAALIAVVMPGSSMLADCADRCDGEVKCVLIGLSDIREFHWQGILQLNTDKNDGEYSKGTDPNEWRNATGTQVCYATVAVGGVITWGKYENCTSNESYSEQNTAEECCRMSGDREICD